MEKESDRVQLSKQWRLFQLYSLQISLGCLSAFVILSLESVKQVFIAADIIAFYALFFAGIVVIGVIAFIFSGGIGLFRLLNAKRLIRLLEKEEENDAP